MPKLTEDALPAELARIQALSTAELKAEWLRLHGFTLKGARRDFLIRGIAYRLQEKIYGGLPTEVRRRLKRLAEQFAADPDFRPEPKRALKAGCRLLREWRGEMHEVVVLEKGFRYRDRQHQSLSEIARLITGTRWSGPVFFGIKKPERLKEEGADEGGQRKRAGDNRPARAKSAARPARSGEARAGAILGA
jgi:hypothetical protein